MANDWDDFSKPAPQRIELRAPKKLLLKINSMCAEEGVSRNEMICRLLNLAIEVRQQESANKNGGTPLNEELLKYIIETHYILSHQYGNTKGRRMDSLALEAAAEARKRAASLVQQHEETL